MVPPAKEVVLIPKGGAVAAITRLKDFEAVRLPESTTWKVSGNVPLGVGVPLMRPLDELSARPAGNEPEIIDQLYGAVPPEAWSVWLYVAFTTPCVRADVVTVSGGMAGLMTILSDCVAVWLAESVTLAMKTKVPAAAGMPEIAPVEGVRDKPVGREPDWRDHVYGSVPPVA